MSGIRDVFWYLGGGGSTLPYPPLRPSFFVVSGKNSSKTCFLLRNTRRKKANQGSPTIFRAPAKRPYLFVVPGKNASKTCFLLHNTRRKKANQGSSAIFLVSPRGLIYSWFLAKTHQKRVFCSTIREERRPIRAHLQLSVPPPQEAAFIHAFWLQGTANVFYAQLQRVCRDLGGAPE